MHAVTFQAAPRGRARREARPELEAPTTRSSGSRRPASAARTSTSTTGASRSSPASRSATSTSARSWPSATPCSDRGGRRPGPRLLPGRLRHLLLLPPRRLPQVRRVADVRPRRHARRPPGHAGRAGARPLREPDAAQDPRRALRRRRAVRRRRHGHRLPRDGRRRDPRGRHRAVLGLGPVGLCAVQSALVAGAAQVVAIDTVEQRLDMAEAFGAIPVHLTEQDPRAEIKQLTGGPRRRPRRRGGRRPPRPRARHPADAQVRDRLDRRRLRRARPRSTWAWPGSRRCGSSWATPT